MQDTRGFLFLGNMAPRDRRALLTGLAIMLPAVLYVFGVKPYLEALADVRERAAVEAELLDRELDLLSSSEDLSAEIQRAKADAERYEDRMVQAASGVLAEGELTDFLESSAVRSRVLLEEIRGGELGRGEEPPPGLSVVRLHLRGESDLEGVLSFLDEIEQSRLLIRIRGLALEPQVARPESDEENDQSRDAVPTGVVEFQLILDGFARVREYTS